MNKKFREIIITLLIGLPILLFVFTRCSIADMRYDSNTPDTEANKKRFKETFGFKPGNDVKKLYCFFDPLGFDVT